MIEWKTIIEKRGKSLAILLPKKQLQKEGFKVGDEIHVIVLPKYTSLKGTFPKKRSTQSTLDENRKGQ